MAAAPHHFLDLSDFSGERLNTIITSARRMKEARAGKPKGVREPGRLAENK